MKEKILKLNDIKSTNLQAVLDVLLQTDGLSRVEIARRIGCDNTTVTRAVGALIEQSIRTVRCCLACPLRRNALRVF